MCINVLFMIPIILSVLQMFLMMFVYKYDTPNNMKDNEEKLKEFMNKIYIGNVATDRINEILKGKDDGEEQNETQAVSYKGICCNSNYSKSTFVGCTLAIF